jgi:hypothetical protein
VRFVNAFFRNKDQIKFTLFFITPLGQQTSSSVPKSEEENTCDLALEKSMHSLITGGFMQENVLCKIKKRIVSAARDIITEGNKGLYDAIVLGRRGITRLEELIKDSVSIRVLEEKRKSPIWICRQIDPKRKDVLVCVDGSEESLRMVDHVGFFLSGEPDHKITLLHVQQEPTETDSMFQQAMESLKEHDIDESRVQSKIVKSSNVASTIEQEARTGMFSAIAVGYTGKGRRGVLTIGSVATKLCYEVTGSALWIG